jgi:hypothetical protein
VIIEEIKNANAAVSVLGAVDAETTLSDYIDAGLAMDGAYFSDPADTERSLKQAEDKAAVPFSVIALGMPLFDAEAVDKADVFVTFAGDAFSIGSWNPYAWYPEQNSTKFAAIVSGALPEMFSSTTAAFLDRGYGYVFVTSAPDFSTPAAGLSEVLDTLSDSGRRLQLLPPTASGRDTYRWGCDDTLLECAPVCFKTRGMVTTRVANAKCGELTVDQCSCKCYFEAEWQCKGSAVTCSARESGKLARRTVGDMVCSSRGTDKPTYEELTKTGVCKPLETQRGSAPPRMCLPAGELREELYGGESESESLSLSLGNSSTSETSRPLKPNVKVFVVQKSTAVSLAVAALAALLA